MTASGLSKRGQLQNPDLKGLDAASLNGGAAVDTGTNSVGDAVKDSKEYSCHSFIRYIRCPVLPFPTIFVVLVERNIEYHE